jgi:hypothetical protein
MSQIHECLTVLCPFDQTAAAAAAYVASLPLEGGKSVVAIRVAVGDLTVERRADLTLKHVRAFPGYEVMEIRLQPHDGGPYPIFKGILSAEESGGNFCRLDLDGAYEPPLGLAGAAFDAVVGHHIAVAAARTLLDEIKLGFEFAFQTGATIP